MNRAAGIFADCEREKRFTAQLAEQGARPYPGSCADMAQLMEKEGKRWREVIDHARISLD
ncbi:hypothetical protein CBM2634_B170092 [Cupriavidus taiwanensis]|uniref:Uncharacterized protein n=1 Tax=Cupriavidus taiwanensis TaxID=164546 RepID=A0A375J6G5_9BURK|nr:hypothetical protein CBM2634_B170092 [Cupriavidus taiwanensis]